MTRSFATFSIWPFLLVLLTFTAALGGERPKIIVGGDHDNPPYEFLENGRPTGFNIELIRAVAEATGFDVEFRLGPWSKVRKELEQGKIDALAGMYYSAERNRQVDFSLPHTMVSAGLFVRKDSRVRSLEDIKGKEVIVQQGDVIHDYLRENGVTSHIVAVTNPEDELRLLASGRHDCALMPSRFQGEYLKRTLWLADLRAISTNLPPFRYCFAVRKGNQELLYRLDEGLNILKVNGRYRNIYEKWFGVYEKKDLWETIKYYVLALALSLALFLGFLIWSGMLKRRVEQRTAELRRSEEELRQAHDELEKRVEERTADLQKANELLQHEIAERKQAEESLLLSQFCIDKAGIGIYQSDGTGAIFNVNEYACKSLGYSREELCALSVFDIDPEITPERMLELKEILDEKGSVTHQTTHRRSDGTTFPVEITANILDFRGRKYGISFVKDITERREAEESLKRAKEEWERTFASVPDLIAILDNRHRVLRVNDAMAKRLGLKPDECVGLPCYAAVHGLSEPPGFCPHTQTLRDGREHIVEVHEERLGGDFLVSTIPLNDERGVMIGSVHIAYDITERKQAEEALRESESRVRRKLESILDPEGDIGELDLADIIDAPQIQALMDDLYRNTGLKMSIIDLKGRVLVDVGWQDICLKFHRAHPETLKNCHESDTDLTEGVPPGEFRTYRCKNNMWHLVTPIFVGGRHMGNLFMGQFFFENEELDYGLFRAQARQYGFPEEEYIAALEAVPRLSEECVDKGKAFFLRLIDMFSRLSYGNIKLAHSLAERDRLTETLRESEARLKLAMDLAKLGAWEYDVSTGLFSFDDQFYALYGTTAEQEGGTLMSAEVYARKFIPPEESAIVANGIAEVQANSYMQLEHRIIRADGMERFIVVRAEAVFDQQGSFVKIRGANQDITERKRAEEELRESRAKYQAIVDNFEGLIYICSQDYRVEFMNRKLIERTGYDATGEFCYRMMHDRDSVCPWCVNERVFAGDTLQWEMFSPKDKHWYYVVNVPIPHADGTISKQSMMLDITDRKQAEEDLRKANMVVENSPVVLFRCKAAPSWPVELVSKNVVQFGYAPEEFLSGELTYSSIVYPRDLGKLIAETEEYSATGKGKWLQEYRIVTKEGDIRWIIDETVCERNEAGEITHYEGVIIDVTERRKAEEQLILQQMQLRELNRTLEERVHEEVEKNRGKDIILIQQNRQAALGEMFDHIAHQWKQPLNTIAVIIQALGSTSAHDQVTTKEILETVDSIMDMVGHMAQTVDVFRNFYRPDKEKSVFLVKDTIDKALTFVTPVLRRYGIEVDIDADPELSAFGYPKEYAQVLLNILGNAKDAFIEKGAENPRISIKAFADGDNTIVTITDNAGGVPDISIESIFDLNFTTKESSGGTGIGLYMSKNIIEKNMGGKLSVRNIDNGAQFRIELGKY